MNEYLKKDDVLYALKKIHQHKCTCFCTSMEKGNWYFDAEEVKKAIEGVDTALCEPVTIGFWRKVCSDKLNGWFACSICGELVDIATGEENPYDRGFRRCNCGAMMSKTPVFTKDLHECVEVCPHCEGENIIQWNAEKLGYVVRCVHCGKEILLCDECMHSENGCIPDCDWCETADGGKCKRGRTHG